MRHRLTAVVSTYGLKGQCAGDEHPAYASGHGPFPFTLLLTLREPVKLKINAMSSNAFLHQDTGCHWVVIKWVWPYVWWVGTVAYVKIDNIAWPATPENSVGVQQSIYWVRTGERPDIWCCRIDRSCALLALLIPAFQPPTLPSESHSTVKKTPDCAYQL